MKNLILCAVASLFLFTSCFEKEEEVTVVSEPPIEEGNVMECKQAQDFITEVQSISPPDNSQDPRAAIKKYNYNGKIVYHFFYAAYWEDAIGIVVDSNCNVICKNSQVYAERDCLDWGEKAVFVEDVWRDNR
ncbi:hypothetical protein ACE193_17730 [Bernardetia sp. OM2101]|uniref:DUF6970 domain-containing protein n=1 Tax=Bernardetia sp. OM2101 TaxID=3344876 RepID=UPI0035CF76AF